MPESKPSDRRPPVSERWALDPEASAAKLRAELAARCTCSPLPPNAGVRDVNRGHLLGCPAGPTSPSLP